MRIAANRIALNVVETGSGPAILRHQIPALSDTGYRVIAPDLAGSASRIASTASRTTRCRPWWATYWESWRPSAWLMRPSSGTTGVPRWAGRWPPSPPTGSTGSPRYRWAHPSGYLTDAIRQRKLSWYMLFFQFVDVAEEALTRDDWALLRSWVRDPSDLERYLADLGRPGALTAALNWYRANITPEAFGRPNPLPLPPADCPVLGVWSSGDHFCGKAQMLASHQHVSRSWRYERIEGASHWIPLDTPDQLSELLIEFLRD